jgi:hypothetical protein
MSERAGRDHRPAHSHRLKWVGAVSVTMLRGRIRHVRHASRGAGVKMRVSEASDVQPH